MVSPGCCFSEEVTVFGLCPCHVREEGGGAKAQVQEPVGMQARAGPAVSRPRRMGQGGGLGRLEGAALTAGSWPPSRWAAGLHLRFRKSDASRCGVVCQGGGREREQRASLFLLPSFQWAPGPLRVAGPAEMAVLGQQDRARRESRSGGST